MKYFCRNSSVRMKSYLKGQSDNFVVASGFELAEKH